MSKDVVQKILTSYRLNVICFTYGFRSYLAGNTFRQGYKNQSVNFKLMVPCIIILY